MKSLLSIIALIAVLFVSVQYAEAEPLIIQANDEDKVISIMIDGEDSVIKYQSNEGSFEAWDSTIKLFKSGFVLKNSETGTVVFARELNDDTWKLTVNTFQGWTKFIGFTVSESSERIEPKSSIGSDISRYDIPADTSRDNVREPRIIAYLDPVSTIMINDEYSPHIKIENQDLERIAADVSLEITRDGYTIKKISKSITNGGWYPVINVLDNYYTPGFCYTITVTATSGNYTDIAQDDFSVITTGKYWDKEADPIAADSQCNK